MCLPVFGNQCLHYQKTVSLSFSVSPLHNGFFVLAKIKGNARAVTDHLGRLYECSVAFSLVQWEILCSLNIPFCTMTVTWGDHSASWETHRHGNLLLKNSNKAVEKFALVVQVGLAVNCCEKNSFIQIFKPK